MPKLHFGQKGGIFYNKNKKKVYLSSKQKQNLFGSDMSDQEEEENVTVIDQDNLKGLTLIDTLITEDIKSISENLEEDYKHNTRLKTFVFDDNKLTARDILSLHKEINILRLTKQAQPPAFIKNLAIRMFDEGKGSLVYSIYMTLLKNNEGFRTNLNSLIDHGAIETYDALFDTS